MLAFVLASCATDGATRKKLIQFGIDGPDTATMRANVQEKAPFDGWVFYVVPDVTGGRKDTFCKGAWRKRAFQKKQFEKLR